MSYEVTKTCGALGCTNEADGVIPHNGRIVWTCEDCAEPREIKPTEVYLNE